MEVRDDAPIEVALSDPEQALMIPDLKLLRARVVGIIEDFRPRSTSWLGSRKLGNGG
jgi:hypothetical protein